MDELIVRAITAYHRHRPSDDPGRPGAASERIVFQGKGYVLLREEPGVQPLAVYRCMNRGELKRLKRWPADLISSSVPIAASEPVLHKEEVPLLLDLVPAPRKDVPQSEAPEMQTKLF